MCPPTTYYHTLISIIFDIYTDASNWKLGEVISQEGKPIAFIAVN